MTFNENLKELMIAMNITTKELSLKTGIKKDTISSYLKTNSSIPPADKALKIATELNTSVEFLVTGFEKDFPDIHLFNKYSEMFHLLSELPIDIQKSIFSLIKTLYEEDKKKNS